MVVGSAKGKCHSDQLLSPAWIFHTPQILGSTCSCSTYHFGIVDRLQDTGHIAPDSLQELHTMNSRRLFGSEAWHQKHPRTLSLVSHLSSER